CPEIIIILKYHLFFSIKKKTILEIKKTETENVFGQEYDY
ncbi:MAG: hypothetical protein ACI9AT_002260, partial [Ulvibacter sp.]